MDDIFTQFGAGKLINLRRDKVAAVKDAFRYDEIMRACERLGRFGTLAERTHTNIDDLEIIQRMYLEEEQKGELRYRRDLTIIPLQTMYELINYNFAEHFGEPEKATRWDKLIGDWLIVSYGFFADYLEGQRYDERKRLWHEFEPPRPEDVTLVATNLAKLVHNLTQAPYSKLLSENNKMMMQELYGHLRPHIEKAPLALAYKM